MRGRMQTHIEQGGDWRCYITALRTELPTLWRALPAKDKTIFLRHALSYWNIHRHRVHEKIYGLLQHLQASQQLIVLAGRVMSVEKNGASIKRRSSQEIKKTSH